MSGGKFSIVALFTAKDGISGIAAAIETRMGKMAKGVSSGLDSISKANTRILDGLASVAMKAAAVGAIAATVVGGGLMQVAHAGMEFEQSITNVGAVMGKNRGQIASLEKEAMRLGVATQFSATEVSEGMEMMARKGFDAQEILQGIPGVLNAVAVSGEGMAEVATVVGSSIRGFGLEADKAGHVADVLAFAAEKTGAKILDMGTALATAAPTAKQLGVSIEDTAAAVGLLQKLGIDASTAGTATATMLAKISKPSKEAAREMATLGLKFQDAKGDMLPFRDVLGQFVKAGEKTGGNMKTMAFFAELVGLRGDKAALGLKEMAKSGEFDRLANGLRTVDGYAQKVADIKLDTTAGSWKLLTSTIEVLEVKLFALKSGALRGVIDGVNQWVQLNGTLIKTRVGEAFESASFAVEAFAFNVKRGFLQAKSVIDPFLPSLERITGHFMTWPENVSAAGRAFGWLGVILPAFLAFTFAVKAAQFAMFAFAAAQRAVTAVVMVARGLMIAYTFVTDGSAASTALLTIATWAGRAATLASNIAMGVRNAITYVAFLATTRFTLSQVASKVASLAAAAATWLWNAAQSAWTAVTAAAGVALVAYEAETVSSTAATEAATVATDLANMSMGTFLVTLGVAAAAVGSLYLAYKQWQDLVKEAAPEGGVWDALTEAASRSAIFGGQGAGALGATANTPEQYDAQRAAAAAYAPSGPGGYASAFAPDPQAQGNGGKSMADLLGLKVGDALKNSKGTITIKMPPGAQGNVDEQPGSGFGINLEPSGAF